MLLRERNGTILLIAMIPRWRFFIFALYMHFREKFSKMYIITENFSLKCMSLSLKNLFERKWSHDQKITSRGFFRVGGALGPGAELNRLERNLL